jgi:hypothetical protein
LIIGEGYTSALSRELDNVTEVKANESDLTFYPLDKILLTHPNALPSLMPNESLWQEI